MQVDDLSWRLRAIEGTLARLPMYAAMWPSLDHLGRLDVRADWWSVCRHLDHIRWHWRRYSRGDPEPEWWLMIGLQVEENERLIAFMELPRPEMKHG